MLLLCVLFSGREMLHGDIRAINVDFIKIFHSLLVSDSFN